MRAFPLVAVLVVVGLLGTGAWFITRDPGVQAPAAERSPAATAETPARTGGAKLVVPDAIPDDGPGRAAVAAEAESLEVTSPAASNAEPAPAMLVGRVVDPAGRPVEGASVSSGDPHETWGMGRTSRVSVETQTDAKGRFELKPDGGSQELRVEADGFVPATMPVTVKAGARKDIGDWGVDPGVILEGIVLDPQRRPVADAEIRSQLSVDRPGLTVVTSEGGPLVTTTDESGRFRVASQAAGDYRFLVATEAYPHAQFEGTTEAPGDHVRDIEVVLDPGAEITGRVMDLPEGEAEALIVRAQTDAGGADGFDLLGVNGVSASPESRESEVAADGSFRLRGLRVDHDYRLTARVFDGPWFMASSRTRPVVVPSGERDVELEYSPGATLVFQAVDAATGEPITEFDVEAGTQWLQPLVDGAGKLQRKHVDGRARYGGLRPDSSSDRVQLVVHAVGYKDYRVEDLAITLGNEEDLGTLRMTRIPIVRVTVLGPGGGPVVGARVTLAPAVEETGERRMSFRMRREVTTEGDDGEGGSTI
ncbi:MAG: hypothetical protein ACI8Y8_004389, partial [Planctomycetota bacterium]